MCWIASFATYFDILERFGHTRLSRIWFRIEIGSPKLRTEWCPGLKRDWNSSEWTGSFDRARSETTVRLHSRAKLWFGPLPKLPCLKLPDGEGTIEARRLSWRGDQAPPVVRGRLSKGQW